MSAWRRRQGGTAEGALDLVTNVTTDYVHFVNDHEARVAFSVVLSGAINMTIADRRGRALLLNGAWRVARETFCEFMQMAGVDLSSSLVVV